MPQNWPWILLQTQPAGAGVQAYTLISQKDLNLVAYSTYALDDLGGLSLSLRSGCGHAGKNDEGSGGSSEELDKILSEVFCVQLCSKSPSS